jgi:hypothetical protein
MIAPTPKYRPYFTYAELQEIISALKSRPTPSRMTLIKYLDGFISDIESGRRKSNLTIEPTLAQKLELEPATPIPVPLTISGEAAYQKWLTNPSRTTAHEIEVANSYRYLNDLMSKEEEKEYEVANGLSFT